MWPLGVTSTVDNCKTHCDTLLDIPEIFLREQNEIYSRTLELCTRHTRQFDCNQKNSERTAWWNQSSKRNQDEDVFFYVASKNRPITAARNRYKWKKKIPLQIFTVTGSEVSVQKQTYSQEVGESFYFSHQTWISSKEQSTKSQFLSWTLKQTGLWGFQIFALNVFHLQGLHPLPLLSKPEVQTLSSKRQRPVFKFSFMHCTLSLALFH